MKDVRVLNLQGKDKVLVEQAINDYSRLIKDLSATSFKFEKGVKYSLIRDIDGIKQIFDKYDLNFILKTAAVDFMIFKGRELALKYKLFSVRMFVNGRNKNSCEGGKLSLCLFDNDVPDVVANIIPPLNFVPSMIDLSYNNQMVQCNFYSRDNFVETENDEIGDEIRELMNGIEIGTVYTVLKGSCSAPSDLLLKPITGKIFSPNKYECLLTNCLSGNNVRNRGDNVMLHLRDYGMALLVVVDAHALDRDTRDTYDENKVGFYKDKCVAIFPPDNKGIRDVLFFKK